MNNKIIFNIYLVNLSKQTSKVTTTFEITKNGIIAPKAGEQLNQGTQEVSSSGNE
jgi:hypothetical protein